MAFLASTLAPRSSKTFCISPDTILVNLRSLHHAATVAVCCHIWGKYETVSTHSRLGSFRFMLTIMHGVVNSVVLLTNGISFAIQAVLLLFIGKIFLYIAYTR